MKMTISMSSALSGQIHVPEFYLFMVGYKLDNLECLAIPGRRDWLFHHKILIFGVGMSVNHVL